MALVKKIADTPEAKEVAEMMKRARAAQAVIEDYNQEQIDELQRQIDSLKAIEN